MNKPKVNILSTIINPFQRFFRIEAAGGIVLLIFTVIAIIWANSKWSDYYENLWNIKFSIVFGDFNLSESLLHWINDGLMAIFFFVVGLEIKREFIAGELSNRKQSMLSVFAAVGGMVVPALLYFIFNSNPEAASGWGIPMATDIAFSLGVLSLLGKRVPIGLKVFLVAFAIVDDLGAVLIIALFYTSDIHLNYLIIGLGLYLYLVLFNFFKVRVIHFYMIIGWIIWYMFLKSGIHPTVAGVLIAFTIPIGKKIKVSSFKKRMNENLEAFFDNGSMRKETLNDDQLASIDNMESEIKRVQSPLQSLELRLHGFVTFVILPLFALANAGIIFYGSPVDSLLNPISKSIAISLVLGKFAGITLFSFIVIKMGWAALPTSVKWVHLIGVSLLGGIGFTMSLFISNLAFTSEALENPAKVGILTGSLVAGILGFIILRLTLKKI